MSSVYSSRSYSRKLFSMPIYSERGVSFILCVTGAKHFPFNEKDDNSQRRYRNSQCTQYSRKKCQLLFVYAYIFHRRIPSERYIYFRECEWIGYICVYSSLLLIVWLIRKIWSSVIFDRKTSYTTHNAYKIAE